MLTLAEKKFKKLVWQLFEKNKADLDLQVKSQTDTSMDVEIRIPGSNAGFRAVIVRTATQHSEEERDPRSFGDTDAVVKAAMADWYPGKTNRWTEQMCHFTLQAWNLPSESMKDFTASYNYDPGNSTNDCSEGYELEKIYQLLLRIQKTRKAEFDAKKETEYADKLTEAFRDLLK